MKLYFLAGLLFCVAGRLVRAQEPVPPYPLPQAGQNSYSMASYLEAKFQDQLSGCMGKKHLTAHTGWWIFGHDLSISAIPQPILNDGSIHRDDQVLPELSESVARAFAYVYTSKSVQQQTLQEAFLDLDYLQDPTTMLPLGLSSTLYNYSCGSNIAWALKSDAGYKWPIADISTALQADFSSSTSAQLGMVFGTFRSPLVKHYQGADVDWKNYATLVMWEWYDQNPDKVGTNSPGYLLKQFDGVSAYRLFTNKEAINGKVDFSAKIASPIISVDTSGQTQYDSNEWIRAENFSAAVKTTISDNDFMVFPASASISALAGAAKLDPSSTDGRLLTTDMKHAQILSGVPPQWCNSDHWHVVHHHKSQVGELHLVDGGTKSIAPSKDSDRPAACSFLVEYSSPAPSDNVMLDYFLVSTIGPQNDLNDDDATPSAPQNAITVRTQQVRLSATGKPVIDATSSHGVYAFVTTTQNGKNFHDFTWNDLSFQVEEDVHDKVASVETNPAVQLVCNGGTRQIPNVTASASYNSANAAQLLIILKHSANDDIEKLDVSGNDDICQLSGSITLNLSSGVGIPKVIPNTTVYYPKPISSPPQSAMSIVSFSPASGPVGTSVIITGTVLSQTTKVSFGGVQASSFTVNSDTRITATVPAGAQTGKIQASAPGGTISSTADYTVTP